MCNENKGGANTCSFTLLQLPQFCLISELLCSITLQRRSFNSLCGFEDLFTEFSENLWLGLVDVMVVVDKKNFRVKFKSGMEVPVEL